MKRALICILLPISLLLSIPVFGQYPIEWTQVYTWSGIDNRTEVVKQISSEQILAVCGHLETWLHGQSIALRTDSTGNELERFVVNSGGCIGNGGIGWDDAFYVSQSIDEQCWVSRLNEAGEPVWTSMVAELGQYFGYQTLGKIVQSGSSTLVTAGGFYEFNTFVNRVTTTGVADDPLYLPNPGQTSFESWDLGSDGIIYIITNEFGSGSQESAILAVTYEDGMIWSQYLNTINSHALGVVALPGDQGGVLARGAQNDWGFIYRIGSLGERVWTRHPGFVVYCAGLTRSGHVIIVGSSTIACLTLDGGNTIWSRDISVPYVPPGSIVQVEDDGFLVAGGGVFPWIMRLGFIDLELTLTPEEIPAEGGLLQVDLDILPGAVRDHDVNIELQLVNVDEDSVYLAHPFQRSLTAFEDVCLTAYVEVPETWPDGPYEIRAEVAATDGRYTVADTASIAKLISGVDDGAAQFRHFAFALHPVYPNPFNSTATITVDVVKPSLVNLSVFDVLGRQVAVLREGWTVSPGTHQVAWDASNVAGGAYFLRASIGDDQQTQRLVLVK